MTFAYWEIMIGYLGNYSSIVFVLQTFALFIYLFVLSRFCNYVVIKLFIVVTSTYL